MTLENLVKLGSVKAHKASKGELLRLLEAARRNLADAAILQISAGGRFDIAYKAIMQSALRCPTALDPGYNDHSADLIPNLRAL